MSKFLDCYFRVSTQEQTKGQSLDTQQEYGKKIAEKLGLKFRPRDEGAKSSTRGFRPKLEEIKEDIERQQDLCARFTSRYDEVMVDLNAIEEELNSRPTEIIDIKAEFTTYLINFKREKRNVSTNLM